MDKQQGGQNCLKNSFSPVKETLFNVVRLR